MRWTWPVLLATCATGALLRALAARGDLWLDEVWSLLAVAQLGSAREILTRFRHDNNHLLNSLALYALGPGREDWAYRAPAVVCGALLAPAAAWTVWLAERAGGRARSAGAPRAGAVFAALLFSFSAVLVQYGSEARGYSAALLLAVLAVALALRGDVARGSRWAFAYWLAGCLAVLAHTLALHALVAVAAWSLARLARGGRLGRGELGAFLWWHGPPAVVLLVYYAGFLKGQLLGGGDESDVLLAVGRASASGFGLPLEGRVWPLLLAGAVLAAGLRLVWRDGSGLSALYGAGIVVSPLVLLGLQRPAFVFPRYFVVNAALLLLLTAQLLARLSVRGRATRGLALLLIGGFVLGNGAHVERLLRDGRGRYREALRDIERASEGRPILVGADDDFQVGLVLDYHAERLGLHPGLRYVRHAERSALAPEWYIEHRSLPAPPRVATVDAAGNRYHFVAGYPSAPLSGASWYVYRNAAVLAR